MGIQKLSSAELRVDDLDEAVAFNVDVFGLKEIGREDGRVFLTCGAEGGIAQLALREGGAGVEAFSLSVDSEDDLDLYGARLREMGVEVEERTDATPSGGRAVSFTLPSAQRVDLVASPDRDLYPHPAFDGTSIRRGVGAVDIDHITIAFGSPEEGQADAELLTKGLGFAISDVMLDPEDKWLAAWTRAGDLHHDVGLMRCQPGATLHHLAWTLQGFDHMKVAGDALAGGGVPIETGPGRHGVGANLFTYFWAPGGNRYELSAEMPRLSGDRTEPLVRKVTDFNSFSAWGTPRPESFTRGS